MIDPGLYDHVVVAVSGGKDSVGCLLWAIESGFKNIEVWHHSVDGRSLNSSPVHHHFDWPVTESYCIALADHLDLPIYFSWLEGGLFRELNKEDARKAPTLFECPDGSVRSVGGERGKLTTRRRFPQQSADLSVRWCSSVAKIDVGRIALRNQERFKRSRTLLVTGERAEESAARSKYKTFEVDRADGRDTRHERHIDRYRPLHSWSEGEVWEIIKRHQISPHPAYHIGFSRVSCRNCIFGRPDQWATLEQIDPNGFQEFSDLESEFGVTINRRGSGKKTVPIPLSEMSAKGSPYDAIATNPDMVAIAMGEEYPVEMIHANPWVLPAGAFGDSGGPT